MSLRLMTQMAGHGFAQRDEYHKQRNTIFASREKRKKRKKRKKKKKNKPLHRMTLSESSAEILQPIPTNSTKSIMQVSPTAIG